MQSKRKRLEDLEHRTQSKETIIAVADVRDLPAAAATAHIAAKRAELAQCGAPAALIILQHRERRVNHVN